VNETALPPRSTRFDANAAHAGCVQLDKFAISDILGHRRNGAQSIGMCANRIEQRAVSAPWTLRLHHNAARYASVSCRARSRFTGLSGAYRLVLPGS